jgi:hypothetical protein
MWGMLAMAGVGHAASTTMTATAIVQAATLSLSTVTNMNFGTIIATGVPSQVRIDASAGAATPSVVGGTATVSGGTSGLVSVTTNINANVTLSYNITGSLLTADVIENATDTMAITDAQVTTYSTPTNLAVTIAGPNSIHVGGQIAVGANQAAGTYTGNCVVTVTY